MKKRRIFLKSLLSYTLLIPTVFAENSNRCIKNRTIFEVGSGSIKAKKAIVDICKEQIVSTQAKSDKTLLIQNHIENSPDKETISPGFMEQIVSTIDELEKEFGINCKKDSCAAAGTAALREAKNSSDLIKLLKRRKNIDAYVIPQEVEGSLGFLSAQMNLRKEFSKDQDILVLDIGGGSSQIVYKSLTSPKNETLTRTVSVRMGSQIFNSLVIEFIKGYPLSDMSSPNPLTQRDISLSERLADKVFGQVFHASPGVRRVLADKNTKVIGIGNFLNKMMPSIFNQKMLHTLKRKDVSNKIKELENKCDMHFLTNYKSIYKLYIPEVVTDLILVSSVMRNLNLNEIHLINVDNNDAILISKEYWKS